MVTWISKNPPEPSKWVKYQMCMLMYPFKMEARLQILMHRAEDATESTVAGRR